MSIETTIGDLKQLGATLRQHRTARGWSLPRAAQHLSIPAVVLGSYERADRNPPIGSLIRILDGYGLQLAVVDAADDDAEVHAQDKAIVDDLVSVTP